MMNKFTLALLAIFLFSVLMQASSIGTFTQENQINVISQDYIDSQFVWSFTQKSKTQWQASFIINKSFWNSAKGCAVSPTKQACYASLCSSSLSSELNCSSGKDTAKLQSDIENMTNYPLTSPSRDMTFSGMVVDTVTGRVAFYINFPNGFKPDLQAKLGFGSTVIGTTITTPFYPNQRAICRDGADNIHAAWLMNTTAIMYANSTNNGATWTLTLLNSSANTKGTPSISCNGNNVTIAYEDATIDAIYVYASTNRGGSFSLLTPATGVVYGIAGGVVVERRGARIYLVWQEKIATGGDIKFMNSTDGGATWGPVIDIETGYYVPKFTDDSYSKPSLAVSGTGTANDKIYVSYICNCISNTEYYYAAFFKNSTNAGGAFSTTRVVYDTDGASSIGSDSLSYNATPEQVFVAMSTGGGIVLSNSSGAFTTWTTTSINQTLGTKTTSNPTSAINNDTRVCVFWQQTNGTTNRDNVVYRGYNGTGWDATVFNVTTDFLQNQYPNSRVDYNNNGIDVVWVNGTSATKNISYSLQNCSLTLPVGGAVIIPEGDSFACNINPYWGDSAKSMPILCSAHSNTTGQPVTEATVTCTVHSSPYFASSIQSVQTCTEQGNGMYNCTFLTANMAANTPYIINCSCAINGVTNWYMGSTYIMQAYYTNYATSTDVTNAQNNILGNMSNNFSATNANINLVLGNQTLILGNESTILTNIATLQTLMGNNFTLVLGNQTLILGNQTLILGNETTIISNIATLQSLMGSNFTYTNGQILLVLNNQTLILGNETLILTNLANVNSTQNANALLILGNQTLILGNETTIITNMATLSTNMNGNFTAITSLLNTLDLHIISTNSTQNANYASLVSSLNSLNTSIISVNTTQNANYAQLQIEIINVNTTQNANVQTLLNSLTGLGAQITSVNVTMLANFSTVYSITLSINTTASTILTDLQQMNQSLNSLHAGIADLNITLLGVDSDLADTYTLLQGVSANLTEHNSTLTTYYNSLLLGLQGMNSTLNDVGVNLTAHDQRVMALLNGIAQNQTGMNASMIADFTTLDSDLNGMNSTIIGINFNILAMNASMMGEFADMDLKLLSLNASINSLNTSLAAYNSTMTSYYNLLSAAIQNVNSTQNSNYALSHGNLSLMNSTMISRFNSVDLQLSDINSSIILASQNILLLQGNVSLLQSDLSSLDSLMGSNFTDLSNQLSAMDLTLNGTNTTVNGIASSISGLNAVISSLNGTLLSINSTFVSLNNSISQGFSIEVTEFPIIVASKTYYAWVNVYDYRGAPANLTGLPVITIYDPLRTAVVTSQPFTYSSNGLYSFSWATTSSSVTGVYESVVTANYNGNIVNKSTFWTVSGSPADVVINSITDSVIPTITANVTIQNKGSQASDFEYIYCIVSSQDNLCGGNDDIAYQTGTHYIDGGNSWTTPLTLNVNSPGVYWFKVKAKALSEVYWAGASIKFTATSPGPIPGSGSGATPITIIPVNVTANVTAPAGSWLAGFSLGPEWIIAFAFCFMAMLLFVAAFKRRRNKSKHRRK